MVALVINLMTIQPQTTLHLEILQVGTILLIMEKTRLVEILKVLIIQLMADPQAMVLVMVLQIVQTIALVATTLEIMDLVITAQVVTLTPALEITQLMEQVIPQTHQMDLPMELILLLLTIPQVELLINPLTVVL